jgi:hypothetical protein
VHVWSLGTPGRERVFSQEKRQVLTRAKLGIG